MHSIRHACRVRHAAPKAPVLWLQKELEQQSETVQRMLHSASTGAAKVMARKMLDTLKREAVAFEETQRLLKGGPGPAPSPSALHQGSLTNASKPTSNVTVV